MSWLREFSIDGLFNTGNVFLQWKCTGRNGNLFRRGGDGTNDFESPLSNPTHDYYPSGTLVDANEADRITVTAFYRNASTNKRIEMGSVTIPVQIRKEFSLAINPASATDLPTDSALNLTAHVKEKLPGGATVEWTWTHAGVGSLAAVPPDNVPSDSAARLDTGATEGIANITVRAVVNLPATATTAARTVQTDTVRAAYNVKKGVRTIAFEASGGAFACTDPRACGVSFYGAYLVPVMPKAKKYTAAFSGFGYGPCNRSVSWTAPVGDGGGCSFPITYHPHNSQGPTNTWAVWLGFSDTWAPDGKCVVTIELAP